MPGRRTGYPVELHELAVQRLADCRRDHAGARPGVTHDVVRSSTLDDERQSGVCSLGARPL